MPSGRRGDLPPGAFSHFRKAGHENVLPRYLGPVIPCSETARNAPNTMKSRHQKGPINPADFFAHIRRVAIIAMFSDDTLMEKLVLKGGNALDLVHRIGGRASMDIDLSIDGEDFADVEDLRNRIFRALESRFDSEGFVLFD